MWEEYIVIFLDHWAESRDAMIVAGMLIVLGVLVLIDRMWRWLKARRERLRAEMPALSSLAKESPRAYLGDHFASSVFAHLERTTGHGVELVGVSALRARGDEVDRALTWKSEQNDLPAARITTPSGDAFVVLCETFLGYDVLLIASRPEQMPAALELNGEGHILWRPTQGESAVLGYSYPHDFKDHTGRSCSHMSTLAEEAWQLWAALPAWFDAQLEGGVMPRMDVRLSGGHLILLCDQVTMRDGDEAIAFYMSLIERLLAIASPSLWQDVSIQDHNALLTHLVQHISNDAVEMSRQLARDVYEHERVSGRTRAALEAIVKARAAAGESTLMNAFKTYWKQRADDGLTLVSDDGAQGALSVFEEEAIDVSDL